MTDNDLISVAAPTTTTTATTVASPKVVAIDSDDAQSCTIDFVQINKIKSNCDLVELFKQCKLICKLIDIGQPTQSLTIHIFAETNDSIHPDKVWHITELTNTAEFGELIQIVNSLSGYDYHLKFKNAEDAVTFRQILQKHQKTLDRSDLLTEDISDTEDSDFMMDIGESKNSSQFNHRTEKSSAEQYFQFYAYLSQQQNMMQDYVRTSTYQNAFQFNACDFQDKVVLDVGAGSGILSFFAAQAGARRVYAVEASDMAKHAQRLVEANELSDVIKVIAGKIEEIDIPELIDVLISEPMGYMLFNERMLESYVHARKWLRQDTGRMFPQRADLHVAPFRDEALYTEQMNKATFWSNQQFHNIVDLSSIRQAALEEYFSQPIVDAFDISCCTARSIRHVVDFMKANEDDLEVIHIPLQFYMNDTGVVHGLAFWFDVDLSGSKRDVWLSTAPFEPLTHWYQVRCLLFNPIFILAGQLLTGYVKLAANKRQSYDITISLRIDGTSITSKCSMDLKNPYFRYTGYAASYSTVSTSTSSLTGIMPSALSPHLQNALISILPSATSTDDNLWGHIDSDNTASANNVPLHQTQMMNGLITNGLRGAVSTPIDMLPTPTINNYPVTATEYQCHQMPNIHPGSISSTGRNQTRSNQSNSHIQPQKSHLVQTSDLSPHHQNIAGILYSPAVPGSPSSTSSPLRQNNILMVAAAATSTHGAQQLIGGAISPSLFPMAASNITPCVNSALSTMITSNLHHNQPTGQIINQQVSFLNTSQHINSNVAVSTSGDATWNLQQKQ